MLDKTVIMLPIDQVIVQENPFKDLDKLMFDKLVKSIEAHGILEPLHVKRDNGYYILIQGHQRYKAAIQNKIKEIPCIIINERDSIGAEYDVNLYRRHLTEEEIKNYEKKKAELEKSKVTLISVFKSIEHLLPKEIIDVLTTIPPNVQETFYRCIPQKIITDTTEIEKKEKQIAGLNIDIREKEKEISILKKKMESLDQENKSLKAIKDAKKDEIEAVINERVK